MIEVELEAEQDTGEVLAWKTEVKVDRPLKELVDSWINKYVKKQDGPFGGAALEQPHEEGQLDLALSPQQLKWAIGDPRRTLWVVPLDNDEEAKLDHETADLRDTSASDRPPAQNCSEPAEIPHAKRSRIEPDGELAAPPSNGSNAVQKPAVVPAAPGKAAHGKTAQSSSQPPGTTDTAPGKAAIGKAAQPSSQPPGRGPAAVKSTPVSQAGSSVPAADDAIEFQQTNPKRSGSSAADRYDKYKKAKTVNEALSLGAVPGDIPNDFKKGYLKRKS
jgi:hypothetical protein